MTCMIQFYSTLHLYDKAREHLRVVCRVDVHALNFTLPSTIRTGLKGDGRVTNGRVMKILLKI